MQKQYWDLDKIMLLLFSIAGVGISFAILVYLSDILFPFCAAFLLAYILNPLVNMLQKKLKFRGLAAIIVLLGLILIAALFLLIFAPIMAGQVVYLGQVVQKLINDNSLHTKLMEYIPENILEKIAEKVNFDFVFGAFQNVDVVKTIQTVLEKLLPKAWGLLSGSARLLMWFFGAILIIMYLFLMLMDFENLRKKLMKQIPAEYNEQVQSFLNSFDKIMNKYFRAQTLIASIVGILFAISFSIMGLPVGLLFGLFIGALNMVPYLQVVSIPLAAFLGLIYSLETGIPFWQVILIITAIYAGVQVLQDMVITPKIMGSALGLSPVLILLSLSVWGKLLGFLGLVVAVPFTCIVFVLYENAREQISKRRYVKD